MLSPQKHGSQLHIAVQKLCKCRIQITHTLAEFLSCSRKWLLPVYYGTPNATKLMKMPVRDTCVNANVSRNKTVTHVNVGTIFRTVTVKNRSRRNDIWETFAIERFPERHLRNVRDRTISRLRNVRDGIERFPERLVWMERSFSSDKPSLRNDFANVFLGIAWCKVSRFPRAPRKFTERTVDLYGYST